MDRRNFIGGGMAGGMLLNAPSTTAWQVRFRNLSFAAAPEIERPRDDRPHAGKVLAAVQPHSDDIALFAAGTVLKLRREGYRVFLIRTTNDEAKGAGDTAAEIIRNNEKDNREVGQRLGVERTIDLGYRSRHWNDAAYVELRARLVYLFRLLRVDTVICDDPWSHYEENPDHSTTGRCVNEACLLAGDMMTFPEHFEAGLRPQPISERYYYSRGPQLVNRIVDISHEIDDKVNVNLANVALGPAGHSGSRLRGRLASEGKRLPLLGADDETADRQYIKHIVLHEDAELGKKHGLAFAEPFHYIGPKESMLERYVAEHAEDL